MMSAVGGIANSIRVARCVERTWTIPTLPCGESCKLAERFFVERTWTFYQLPLVEFRRALAVICRKDFNNPQTAVCGIFTPSPASYTAWDLHNMTAQWWNFRSLRQGFLQTLDFIANIFKRQIAKLTAAEQFIVCYIRQRKRRHWKNRKLLIRFETNLS